MLGPRVGGFGSAVPLDQVVLYCELVGVRGASSILRLAGYLDALQAAAHEHFKDEDESDRDAQDAAAEAKRTSEGRSGGQYTGAGLLPPPSHRR